MKPLAGDTTTRVMLAVMTLHERREGITVRAVAGLVELTPKTTFLHLKQLRRLGLVTWLDGSRRPGGTIMPTVDVVAAG